MNGFLAPSNYSHAIEINSAFLIAVTDKRTVLSFFRILGRCELTRLCEGWIPLWRCRPTNTEKTGRPLVNIYKNKGKNALGVDKIRRVRQRFQKKITRKTHVKITLCYPFNQLNRYSYKAINHKQ